MEHAGMEHGVPRYWLSLACPMLVLPTTYAALAGSRAIIERNMRKSFVLLSCALALAIWSALSFAQQQGSGASSKVDDSSASQSSPNDVPSPDDLPGSKPSTPAPNSAQTDSSAPQSQSQKQNSDAKSSRPQQT